MEYLVMPGNQKIGLGGEQEEGSGGVRDDLGIRKRVPRNRSV